MSMLASIIVFNSYQLFEQVMNWKIAEAKQKFSELIQSTLKEPQLIYNRDRLVAVVIEAEAYHDFLTWRERQLHTTTMAEALQELQQICAEDDYTFTIPDRQDRNNAFVEAL